MYQAAKRRIATVLAVGGGRIGTGIDGLLVALIVCNVLAVMVGTVDWIHARYGAFLDAFQFVSIGVFTVEYLGRLWSAPERDGYAGPIVGRLRFASRPYMLVDLLAILPFFVGLVAGPSSDLRFLRAIRLFWFLKLFQRTKYGRARRTFARVIRRKREDLTISLTAALILLVVASSLTYLVERRAQPDAFSSIPEAMWWGAITLTTVGYGDVVPVTPLGKFLGAVTALGGIAFLALPASILAAGFIEESAGESESGATAPREPTTCPHCGERIDGTDRPSE